MHGRISLATVAAALLLAAPAVAAVPAGNLVVNPGAEAGAGATDSSTQLPLPGWTVESTFTAVAYGAPDFLTVEDAARLGGGTNFFAGGPGGGSPPRRRHRRQRRGDGDRRGQAQRVLLGADRRLRRPGRPGDGRRHAVERVRRGHRAGDDARAGHPAERAATTNLLPRSTSSPCPPARARSASASPRRASAGSYNDGYVDNVNLSLRRRRAGRRQERRASGAQRDGPGQGRRQQPVRPARCRR